MAGPDSLLADADTRQPDNLSENDGPVSAATDSALAFSERVATSGLPARIGTTTRGAPKDIEPLDPVGSGTLVEPPGGRSPERASRYGASALRAGEAATRGTGFRGPTEVRVAGTAGSASVTTSTVLVSDTAGGRTAEVTIHTEDKARGHKAGDAGTGEVTSQAVVTPTPPLPRPDSSATGSGSGYDGRHPLQNTTGFDDGPEGRGDAGSDAANPTLPEKRPDIPETTVSGTELRDLFVAAQQYRAERAPQEEEYLDLLGVLVGCVGVETDLTLPDSVATEINRLAAAPYEDFVPKLDYYGSIDPEHRLSLEDTALIERALSLLQPRSADMLIKCSPAGGNMNPEDVAAEYGWQLKPNVGSMARSRARREFREFASALARGAIDWKEHAVSYSKRPRSVLTLLGCLGVEYGPTETMDELRQKALDAVRSTDRISAARMPYIIALYGLTDDDPVPKTGKQAAASLGVTGPNATVAERELLGILPDGWRLQYRPRKRDRDASQDDTEDES